MSITAADASAIQQAQLASEVNMAVLKKGRDVQEQQGDAAIALLEAAAQIAKGPSDPAKGNAIDVRG